MSEIDLPYYAHPVIITLPDALLESTPQNHAFFVLAAQTVTEMQQFASMSQVAKAMISQHLGLFISQLDRICAQDNRTGALYMLALDGFINAASKDISANVRRVFRNLEETLSSDQELYPTLRHLLDSEMLRRHIGDQSDLSDEDFLSLYVQLAQKLHRHKQEQTGHYIGKPSRRSSNNTLPGTVRRNDKPRVSGRKIS